MASVGGSVSTQVYKELRKRILSGEIPQGERMVEAKVARNFNVSITPVREAFSLLASQGLLTVIPYCATYVTILSKESAVELLELRKVLESAAIAMAFPRLKQEDADYLHALCVEADVKNNAGEYLASIECDVRFHEFFIERSGNNLLCEVWKMLRDRIVFFQSVTRPNCQAIIKDLVTRHSGVVQALRRMDEDALKAAMEEHLNTTMMRMGLPEQTTIAYK